MSLVPLRVRSHWSLLDGVPAVEALVDHAAHRSLPALALTDANALYGAIEFVQHCRAAAIQPILGVDFTFESQHTLTLLARSLTGYGQLCRLVTRLQAAPDREARLDRGLQLADLIDAADVIALSDGHELGSVIDRVGKDHVYVALPMDVSAPDRFELAHRFDVPAVAAPDIRYLSAADAPRYRVLAAMRLNRRVHDLPDLPDYAWPALNDIERFYAAFPRAADLTAEIAARCRFEFPLGQYRFPTLDLPAGRTPRDELEQQAWAGAQARYGTLTSEVEARLRKEIDVIDTLGYSPYFLVVADIVRDARAKRVPVSPRGSASSSVVAYCLGIHDVDPMAHRLYFERFLSLERRDPPDIDLDLCSRRRDEVIDYVYRRYGADHVAMVCTYATLQPRSALREVGKAYGLSEQRLSELVDALPHFWHPGMRQQARDAQAELLDRARDPIEREVIDMSRTLTGAPHHLSIHPGGIVIAPDPITNLVPLQYATKGLLITQFDLKSIEQLGLIKIDLLGISALTVAADCEALVQEVEPGFRLESIPLNDAATTETLAAAQTIGCFQIESGGMRFTLRELAARTIDDLIVALALYRPGPLKGGLKDAFVRRHRHQERPEYLHPALEPILRETYGVILYQEQVLRLAHEVAGLSLGQADLLRRAMSKFRSAHEMAKLRQQFVAGAERVGGLNAEIADRVWELMAAFAGYGFPKAHAAGYAALAYRLAYLKTHHPAEFCAARLAVWGGYYSPRVYLAEARRLNLRVKPPHVNHSADAFTLDRSDRRTLWMGLAQVRELTYHTRAAICQARPFVSLDDFLVRARPLHVEAVNLIKCSALDGLCDPAAALAQVQREPWRGRHAPQLRLSWSDEVTTFESTSIKLRAAWEKEILGYPVSVHPLDLHLDRLARENAIASAAIAEYVDQPIALGGVRFSHHHVQAAPEKMVLVDMEDQRGWYQVLWSGAALQRARPLIASRAPMLVRGRVRVDRHGRPLVVGASLHALTDEV